MSARADSSSDAVSNEWFLDLQLTYSYSPSNALFSSVNVAVIFSQPRSSVFEKRKSSLWFLLSDVNKILKQIFYGQQKQGLYTNCVSLKNCLA